MNHLTFLNHSYFSFVSSVNHLSLVAIRLYRRVADALCYLAGSAGRLANLKLSHNYFISTGSTLIKDGVLDAKHNRPGECTRLVPETHEDVIGVERTSSRQSGRVCPGQTLPDPCPINKWAKICAHDPTHGSERKPMPEPIG
jgi:hypothetical protein